MAVARRAPSCPGCLPQLEPPVAGGREQGVMAWPIAKVVKVLVLVGVKVEGAVGRRAVRGAPAAVRATPAAARKVARGVAVKAAPAGVRKAAKEAGAAKVGQGVRKVVKAAPGAVRGPGPALGSPGLKMKMAAGAVDAPGPVPAAGRGDQSSCGIEDNHPRADRSAGRRHYDGPPGEVEACRFSHGSYSA
jgi:hypothetical protein